MSNEPFPTAATMPGFLPCCTHCRQGCAGRHRKACNECAHPHLCWSRHFDNIGKPRPEATWTLVYGCQNGHEVTANVCDRCASSLVDARQYCDQCVRGMVVTSLTEYALWSIEAVVDHARPDEDFGPGLAPTTAARVVLITLAVLLPTECADVDVDEIVPLGVRCEGWAEDTELTDFIGVKVQEAKLVMT